VDVQGPSIVEDEELMLRALLDGDDPAIPERGERARRDASRKRGVNEPDACDRLANDRAANAPRGAFDFRQLRHRVDREGIGAGN
jgi:hypothetical protein